MAYPVIFAKGKIISHSQSMISVIFTCEVLSILNGIFLYLKTLLYLYLLFFLFFLINLLKNCLSSSFQIAKTTIYVSYLAPADMKELSKTNKYFTYFTESQSIKFNSNILSATR